MWGNRVNLDSTKTFKFWRGTFPDTTTCPSSGADTSLRSNTSTLALVTMASSSSTQARIVVMASGSGSNFQALLDGLATSRISHAQIVRLFVNRKTAYAATRAANAGVSSEYFNMVAGGFQAKGEKDPEKLTAARMRYDAALAEKVLAAKPDLVVLAGWMHVFTEGFLKPIGESGVRVINLHPALPGESFLASHGCSSASLTRILHRQIRRCRCYRTSLQRFPGGQA